MFGILLYIAAYCDALRPRRRNVSHRAATRLNAPGMN